MLCDEVGGLPWYQSGVWSHCPLKEASLSVPCKDRFVDGWCQLAVVILIFLLMCTQVVARNLTCVNNSVCSEMEEVSGRHALQL